MLLGNAGVPSYLALVVLLGNGGVLSYLSSSPAALRILQVCSLCITKLSSVSVKPSLPPKKKKTNTHTHTQGSIARKGRGEVVSQLLMNVIFVIDK